MHDVHTLLGAWMKELGMDVSTDAAGNLRAAKGRGQRRLIIGSHLDTVPNAGAFDGVLGVIMGLALVEATGDSVPGLTLEVIGFSEEEGVRFGVPFIGSRAVVGTLDETKLPVGATDAVRRFGLDPGALPSARLSSDSAAYLEFHIEQGPVLESAGESLGVVECVAGQSGLNFTFRGAANHAGTPPHAGTTPMEMRRDALTAAAEWIVYVEDVGRRTPGLVATTGSIQTEPNATNVITARATVSLDVRHAVDDQRLASVSALKRRAEDICRRRGIGIEIESRLDQPAVPMDAALVNLLTECGGGRVMTSGAGHDAMIIAPFIPAVMLFLRSPGGVSRHPDESVNTEDVEAALNVGVKFIQRFERALV